MSKRKYRAMNEEDFNTLKKLIDLGLSYRMIQDLTGRSSSTVSYVKKAEDFEEYTKLVSARFKSKPEAKPIEQNLNYEAADELGRAIELLKELRAEQVKLVENLNELREQVAQISKPRLWR